MFDDDPRVTEYLHIFTPRSISFLKTLIRSSYSTTLLVHSNSNLHAIRVLFFLGSTKTHLDPTPSLVLKTSKYRVQKSSSRLNLGTFVLHSSSLGVGSWVQKRISEMIFSGTGEVSIGKYPKKVSI